MERLADLAVATFLARVASTEPTPGAGPAGAFALAMGIACALKAVAITAKHHATPDPDLDRSAERLAAIGEAARQGADMDAETFGELIASLRLPHATAQAGAVRHAAIHAAAAAVVEVAERLIRLSEEAAELVAGFKDGIDPVMAGDVNTALRLIEANRLIQTDNLIENRRLMESRP
ncbi:MAG: cyclodeaminase/cyclohydrolase family protein [Caulobacteraceae bacterium]